MRLTVILTSYNHEKFLAQSIESVLNQSYQNYEFIIVDDFSTDSSWDIICRYKEKYPKIITIRHEYNWGGGTVEDVVLKYATGDYIALHHSDDVWEKDKLQKQIDIIENNPAYAAVFTNACAIDDEGKEYDDKNGFYYKLFSVENRSRYEWLNHFFYNGNCLCHPSILIKKSVYEEDGFFRKGLKQIPDFVKWIQVCKKHEIYVIPERLVKFRIHNEGKNTSGMRASTQIRSTVELNLMLMEYASIRDREEFLKIFPEADLFCTEDFFSTDYALGRICTEEGMPSYTKMFGNQLLYRVLNDPSQAKKIKEKLNYTEKKFKSDNGKYDIFGILPKAFEQKRSIYYDQGDGFSISNMITEKFTLGDCEMFEMHANISVKDDGKLLALRFDPSEGVMISAKIEHVEINGIISEAMAENSLCSQKGKDIFITLDPIYRINIPKEVSDKKMIAILISGIIERIPDEKIEQVVMSEMYKNRDEKYEIEGQLSQIKDENAFLKNHKSQLENEKNQLTILKDELESNNTDLTAELNRIKATYTYRICAKLKGIMRK